MTVNGETVVTSAKCPTCGHIHPNGIGLGMCLCEDCHLIYHSNPAVLCDESANRRDELLAMLAERQQEDSDE